MYHYKFRLACFCLLLITAYLVRDVEGSGLMKPITRNSNKPLAIRSMKRPLQMRDVATSTSFPYFFILGRAEYVTGPEPSFPDNPLATVHLKTKTYGYTANSITYMLMKGCSVDSVERSVNTTGLGYGSNSSDFDACGSWLNSAAVIGNIAVGWYHAEAQCDYNIGQTHKSIAYAASLDGKNWEKPNYPNNRIITGYAPFEAGQTTGAGDHSVITLGSYYYAYFEETPSYKITVARSPVYTGGKPGTWTKWHQGSFSQPGLGGNYSPVNNMAGTSVVVLSTSSLSHYLLSVGEFQNGVFMSVNDGMSPTNFSDVFPPLFPSSGMTWLRAYTSPELCAYVSFSARHGGSSIDVIDSFYMYYTYLFPQQGFATRYMMRQEITLLPTNEYSPPTSAMVVTLLSRYTDNSSNYWTSSKPVVSPFSFDKHIGYIATMDPQEDNILLVECQVTLNATNATSSTQYVVQVSSCSQGLLYRILGYIWNTSGSQMDKVYFCSMQAAVNASSFLSRDYDCEGVLHMKPTLLGYILSPYL